MIKGKEIYDVFVAVVPLYVAMLLGYASVKWWKIFTPEQCAGINRFVAVFAVPFLGFTFISSNNPYSMNFLFLAADSLQKVVILAALFLWQAFSKNGSIEWTITLFSLSTLPNTLVIGVPLLTAMYGRSSGDLMIQIVVLQSIIWYTVMIIMFEFRGAKLLISEQFPETAGSISSFKVESDVVSLSGNEPLQADAEIGDDGKLHVVLRRLASISLSSLSSFNMSNRNSSINSMGASRASNLSGVEIFSVQSPRQSIPRASSVGGGTIAMPPKKELHMFVWSSSMHDLSENVNSTPARKISGDNCELEIEEGLKFPMNGSPCTFQDKIHMEEGIGAKKHQTPPSSVMTRLVLIMVSRKLIRNPNTYSSLLGLVWSLISFRYHLQMPLIIKGSVSILSNAGLGMAMFSLGLFMALQPKLIACGKSVAALTLAVRFLAGPAVIAATSLAIGIRGVLLRVTIVQAALPEGIVPFVFAKEYNVHATVLCTAVNIGMLLAIPITIVYYILLDL